MKRPGPSAAARIVAELERPGSRRRLRLRTSRIILELHDLAVRVQGLAEPAAVVTVPVTPSEVVEHQRALRRAGRLLMRTPHRLRLHLSVGNGTATEELWAFSHLQAIRIETDGAIDFAVAGRVPPPLQRHFFPSAGAAPPVRGERARDVWSVVLRRSRGDPADDLATELERNFAVRGAHQRPVLLSLDRPGDWLELVPCGRVGRSLRFRAGTLSADDPKLVLAAKGDRLQVGPGRIAVRRGGKLLCTFFLDAWIFWKDECWDAGFWLPCAVHALAGPAPTIPSQQPRATEPAPSPATVLLSGRLQSFLAAPSDAQAGYRIESVVPSSGSYAAVTVESAGETRERLVVHIEPWEGAEKFLCRVGPWAVSYSQDTPLDGPFRRRALEHLLRRLATFED